MWSLSYLAYRMCSGSDRLRTALLSTVERFGMFVSLAIATAVGGLLFSIHGSFVSFFAVFVSLGFVEVLSLLHRKPRLLKPFHVELPSMNDVNDGKRIAGVMTALFFGWVATALVLQAFRGEGA